MPVNTPHPLYRDRIAVWQRCRDAYEGEDAVKGRGNAYLPKVDPGQTGAEYDAYKARAVYYEAVSRTVDGFVGAIARKQHTIEMPPALQVLQQDITADGTGIGEYVKRLCGEALLIGRCGILVDYDAEQQRSYLALYRAEAILNWSTASVVLSEKVFETTPDDPFVVKAVEQIRQLHMVDGAYTVTIWRKPSAPTVAEWIIQSHTVPTQRGKPLSEIPFFWLSAVGRTAAISKPPLLGLVNICLSHYRTSADLEHGRHFCALPTLYVTGISSEVPIRVGAAAAIILPDPQCRVGYAEFSGAGLGSLETALSVKEHQMAMLGAMVLSGGKKGVEAAETARIRVSGETSLLAGIVSAVQETLLAAVQFAAAWMDVADVVTIELNQDYVDQQLDPQTLIGLVAAYQAGILPVEQFLWNLDQAEMLRPDTDLGAEAKALADAKAASDAKVAIVAAAAKVAPARVEGA